MVTLGVLLWPSLLLRSASSGDLAIHCLGMTGEKPGGMMVEGLTELWGPCGEILTGYLFLVGMGLLKVGGSICFFLYVGI